jgi:hypothetical protein
MDAGAHRREHCEKLADGSPVSQAGPGSFTISVVLALTRFGSVI